MKVPPPPPTPPEYCDGSTVESGLYDRKSDPEAKVIPKITRTDPLIICRMRLAVLCQFQLGTSPGQPLGISSKAFLGELDLTFESCPGAGNSTRTRISWKMKVKLQKNSVDQIFTGKNNKRS